MRMVIRDVKLFDPLSGDVTVSMIFRSELRRRRIEFGRCRLQIPDAAFFEMSSW